MFSSGSIFSKPFESQATVAPSVVVTPWYLLGGVTAAQCVAAYQPKGAADLAASYINLNNPGTNNIAPGTAPTLDASGWAFDAASSQYLKVTLSAIANTWSFIIQFSDASSASGNKTLMGTNSVGGARLELTPFRGGNTAWRFGAAYFQKSGNMASGNLCAASSTAYKDGVSVGSITLTVNPGTTLGIGAQADPSQFLSVKVQAAAIYNITLSSIQVGLISTAMAAL